MDGRVLGQHRGQRSRLPSTKPTSGSTHDANTGAAACRENVCSTVYWVLAALPLQAQVLMPSSNRHTCSTAGCQRTA